jgi:hypothetical protein
LEGCDIDDLDDGHDETRRYKSLSHGPAPIVASTDGLEAAAAQAIRFIADFKTGKNAGPPPSICIISSGEKNRNAMSLQLESAGLSCVTISAQSNHGERHDVVHLATMHRAKGLEFDAVVVVAPASFFGDIEETQNQRRLLYVALTRAKRVAVLIRLD